MKCQSRTARHRAAALASLLFFASAAPSAADRDGYPADGDHPLRIVHYFVAPVGTLLEWTVTRPLAVIGDVIAPYEHIDSKGFQGCSRERPARSCTDVIR